MHEAGWDGSVAVAQNIRPVVRGPSQAVVVPLTSRTRGSFGGRSSFSPSNRCDQYAVASVAYPSANARGTQVRQLSCSPTIDALLTPRAAPRSVVVCRPLQPSQHNASGHFPVGSSSPRAPYKLSNSTSVPLRISTPSPSRWRYEQPPVGPSHRQVTPVLPQEKQHQDVQQKRIVGLRAISPHPRLSLALVNRGAVDRSTRSTRSTIGGSVVSSFGGSCGLAPRAAPAGRCQADGEYDPIEMDRWLKSSIKQQLESRYQEASGILCQAKPRVGTVDRSMPSHVKDSPSAEELSRIAITIAVDAQADARQARAESRQALRRTQEREDLSAYLQHQSDGEKGMPKLEDLVGALRTLNDEVLLSRLGAPVGNPREERRQLDEPSEMELLRSECRELKAELVAHKQKAELDRSSSRTYVSPIVHSKGFIFEGSTLAQGFEHAGIHSPNDSLVLSSSAGRTASASTKVWTPSTPPTICGAVPRLDVRMVSPGSPRSVDTFSPMFRSLPIKPIALFSGACYPAAGLQSTAGASNVPGLFPPLFAGSCASNQSVPKLAEAKAVGVQLPLGQMRDCLQHLADSPMNASPVANFKSPVSFRKTSRSRQRPINFDSPCRLSRSQSPPSQVGDVELEHQSSFLAAPICPTLT